MRLNTQEKHNIGLDEITIDNTLHGGMHHSVKKLGEELNMHSDYMKEIHTAQYRLADWDDNALLSARESWKGVTHVGPKGSQLRLTTATGRGDKSKWAR